MDFFLGKQENSNPTDFRPTWAAEPVLKTIVEFEASLKKYPPIKAGAPDPYLPPKVGMLASLPSEVGGGDPSLQLQCEAKQKRVALQQVCYREFRNPTELNRHLGFLGLRDVEYDWPGAPGTALESMQQIG